jgi:hypothetical protein
MIEVILTSLRLKYKVKFIIICTVWILGCGVKRRCRMNSQGDLKPLRNYCPSLEIPGQILRVSERKPWAPKRRDLLPKMTNLPGKLGLCGQVLHIPLRSNEPRSVTIVTTSHLSMYMKELR